MQEINTAKMSSYAFVFSIEFPMVSWRFIRKREDKWWTYNIGQTIDVQFF